MDGFYQTPAGKVPQVRSTLLPGDHFGTLRSRIGFRTDYTVQPGLYRIGEAGPQSPVIVTANYKLTFDVVRSELAGVDCWLLVVDTNGINVWCAGGKGSFSAERVADVVRSCGLDRVVEHRTLVLPQLAANGVAAHTLSRLCGFKGIFGPVLAQDLPRYLAAGNVADDAMRRVTFTLRERMVLAPVEVALSLKWLAVVCLVGFILSGIGPSIWSFDAAWHRGLSVFMASVAGVLTGALVVPALLPQLPGRSFALKGAVAGLCCAGLYVLPWAWSSSWTALLALSLWTIAISSWMAMNYTGSTPFTSPTGVEREMKQAIPWQLGGAACALLLWVVTPFLTGGQS